MKKFLFIGKDQSVCILPVSEVVYNEIVQCLKVSSGDESPVKLSEKAKEQMNVLSIENQGKENSFIFIKDRDYFRKIDFSQIQWIEASGSYCCLHMLNDSKLMLSFNLSELLPHLPDDSFMRVHRSYIVNIHQIESFIGNMLCIGKARVPISKQHKSSVIHRLNVLGNVK